MAIKDWPEGERPRERMAAHGPQVLSDAELLAVILRTGTMGQSALDLGRAALARFGGLAGLLAAPAGELVSIEGLGPAKGAQLQAVLELARRSLQEEVRRDTVLSSPGKVRDYLRISLSRLGHEVFMATLSRLAESSACRRRTLPRHPDADERLSARSREARPDAQRRAR